MGVFRRPKLAAEMTRELLEPGVFDQGLRSGLFLYGLRRTGKTTFVLNDLIPALQAAGSLVIYVDLWSDTRKSPWVLVLGAVHKTMAELQTPASSRSHRLKDAGAADADAFDLNFGFKLDSVGTKGGPTLAEALTAVVDQARTNVVLIVDEVQHAITPGDGSQMLMALKSARDAINARPETLGHFIFVGVGSHRALVSELTTRRNQAFLGAMSVAYPLLTGTFVEHVLARLAEEGASRLPSLGVATRAFVTLGNRPEELLKALRQLGRSLSEADDPEADPDQFLPVIAATLRSTAADIELGKVEQLGGLATAIFERIASSEADARGVFSAAAAADYAKAVGREVRVEELQPVVNELLEANLIMRLGHGRYGVTDPFVRQTWREKKALQG